MGSNRHRCPSVDIIYQTKAFVNTNFYKSQKARYAWQNLLYVIYCVRLKSPLGHHYGGGSFLLYGGRLLCSFRIKEEGVVPMIFHHAPCFAEWLPTKRYLLLLWYLSRLRLCLSTANKTKKITAWRPIWTVIFFNFSLGKQPSSVSLCWYYIPNESVCQYKFL